MSRMSYYKTKQLYPNSRDPSTERDLMNGWGNISELPRLKTPKPSPQPISLKVRYKFLERANPGSPEVWGPAFWFSLHNGASRYPVRASPLWRERMKSFIKGIPVMVPCEMCADHATAYIESRADLDEVVKNRESLISFFVDFHNFVNKRLGKTQLHMEVALKMYKGTANVLTVEYGPP